MSVLGRRKRTAIVDVEPTQDETVKDETVKDETVKDEAAEPAEPNRVTDTKAGLAAEPVVSSDADPKPATAAEPADTPDTPDREDTEDPADAADTPGAAGTADAADTVDTADTSDTPDTSEGAAAETATDAELKAMKAKVKAAKAEMKAAKKAAGRRGSKRADSADRVSTPPSRTTVFVLVLAVVVLAVPAVLLSLKALKLGRSADAADQAVHTASQVARDLSSYDYRTLDSDTKTALAGTTGKLRTDYEKLAQQVRQLAVQQQAVSQTTVLKAGVETASPDRVTVVVFANRSTAKAAQKEQSLPESLRIRMTMVKVKDRWLASDLTVL